MFIKTSLVALMSAVACQPVQTNDAALNIVGGSETSKHPGVIRFLVEKESGRFCTGVVVSDTTALLAGHCIKNSTLKNQIYAERIDKKGEPLISKQVYFWGSVGGLELLNPETIARDLAVVVYPQGTFKPPYVKISQEALAGKRSSKNTPITLVGYGANELGSAQGARTSMGIKREGQNVIFSLEDGFYKVRSELGNKTSQTNAIGALGDAGAPLLDSNGHLIGLGAGILLTSVDSSGSEKVTKITKDDQGYPSHFTAKATYAYNAFVDLSSETSRKLLQFAAWTGRPGKGLVVIPGLEPTENADLSDEDASWIGLNNKDRGGDWVAMTGGGGIVSAKTSLALQGASVSCSNGQSQQVSVGNASASCSASGGGGIGSFGGNEGFGGSTQGPASDFNSAFGAMPPMEWWPPMPPMEPMKPLPPMPPMQPFAQWPSMPSQQTTPTTQFPASASPITQSSGPGVQASATPGGYASASNGTGSVQAGTPSWPGPSMFDWSW